MKERFMMLTYDLAKANGFVSPRTGEFVKMTPAEKLIYVYLKSKNDFFRGEGKEHFETQQTIADAVNVSRKTVNIFLSSIMGKQTDGKEGHGVVFAHQSKHRNYTHWVYEKVLDLKLWVLKDKKPVVIEPVKFVKKVDKASKPAQNNYHPDWMDEEDPF